MTGCKNALLYGCSYLGKSIIFIISFIVVKKIVVLPKFEVQIIVEKKIFTGLIKMQWKVCAR